MKKTEKNEYEVKVKDRIDFSAIKKGDKSQPFTDKTVILTTTVTGF